MNTGLNRHESQRGPQGEPSPPADTPPAAAAAVSPARAEALPAAVRVATRDAGPRTSARKPAPSAAPAGQAGGGPGQGHAVEQCLIAVAEADVGGGEQGGPGAGPLFSALRSRDPPAKAALPIARRRQNAWLSVPQEPGDPLRRPRIQDKP